MKIMFYVIKKKALKLQLEYLKIFCVLINTINETDHSTALSLKFFAQMLNHLV